MSVRKRGTRWCAEAYDPITKAKRYIGTYFTYEEAAAVENAVRAGLPVPERDSLGDFRVGIEPVVYFLSAPDLGYVKIGWSTNLAQRIGDLTVACPVEVRLLHIERGATREREAELHRMFRLYRVRGEWVRIAGHLAEFLSAQFDGPHIQLAEEAS